MPSTKPLPEEQLHELLHQLPEWALDDGKLVRSWTHPTFVDAIAFVNRVAQLAEEAQHHPDIDIRYNRVRLALVTHSAGGLTEKDFDLAAQVQNLAT